MNEEQLQALSNLVYAVQSIRRACEGSYLPFEVSAAIERADQQQSECFSVIDELRTELGKDNVDGA
jgi:hypothetical protein